MKKMMMIAALTVAAVSAMAQSDQSPVDAYFTTSEMPDMLKWCPAPPDTASSAFAYDITQYFWGKKMRNCKERADIAIRDAVYGLDCIIREFSEPFGLQISKEETPEIYKVADRPIMPPCSALRVILLQANTSWAKWLH